MSIIEADKYVRRFRKLEEQGIDLKQFYSDNIRVLLGESATKAMLFHIGEEAFRDPASFTKGVSDMFGSGSRVLLNYLMEQAVILKKAREVQLKDASR